MDGRGSGVGRPGSGGDPNGGYDEQTRVRREPLPPPPLMGTPGYPAFAGTPATGGAPAGSGPRRSSGRGPAGSTPFDPADMTTAPPDPAEPPPRAGGYDPVGRHPAGEYPPSGYPTPGRAPAGDYPPAGEYPPSGYPTPGRAPAGVYPPAGGYGAGGQVGSSFAPPFDPGEAATPPPDQQAFSNGGWPPGAAGAAGGAATAVQRGRARARPARLSGDELDEVSFTGQHQAFRDGHRPPSAGPPGPVREPAPARPARRDLDSDLDDVRFTGRHQVPRDRDAVRRPRRRPLATTVKVLVVALVLVAGVSLGRQLALPGSDGATSRVGDWARAHHLGFVIDQMDKLR
jgi:hypothetical protein